MDTLHLEVFVSYESRQIVVKFSTPSTSFIHSILENTLNQCGYGKISVNWIVRHEGKLLRLEQPLSTALEGNEDGDVIRLFVSVGRPDVEDGPALTKTDRDKIFNDTHFSLEVDDLEDSTSEAFALDEDDVDLNAATAMAPAILDEDEEGEFEADAPSGEIGASWDVEFESSAATSTNLGSEHGSTVGAVQSPPEVSGPRLVPSGQLVSRHSTVRYYSRMNPSKIFPLLVLMSIPGI